MLAIYLCHMGVGSIHLLKGGLPADPAIKHVWLRVEDIDIDITADQFKNVRLGPVIVERESAWHAALVDIEKWPFGFEQYQKHMGSGFPFSGWYSLLAPHLE